MRSSRGRSTFCPGETVTLTCSLTSSSHTWNLPGDETDYVVKSGNRKNFADNGKISFEVTGLSSDDNVTTSTMTFTASESVDAFIGNGSLVFCGGASDVMPRVIFNYTIYIFGE